MSEQLNSKVITGKVRFCYVHVDEPYRMNETDKPKYSVCVLIDKEDTETLGKIEKTIEAVKQANRSKLVDKKGNFPASLFNPLRDGDDERGDDEAFAGKMFLNAKSEKRPGIVDANLDPILDLSEFYSGCYGRASITFFAFDNKSKGIGVGLNNLQKLEDGESLSGGASAATDFAD